MNNQSYTSILTPHKLGDQFDQQTTDDHNEDNESFFNEHHNGNDTNVTEQRRKKHKTNVVTDKMVSTTLYTNTMLPTVALKQTLTVT